jgi:hypothetical protein
MYAYPCSTLAPGKGQWFCPPSGEGPVSWLSTKVTLMAGHQPSAPGMHPIRQYSVRSTASCSCHFVVKSNAAERAGDDPPPGNRRRDAEQSRCLTPCLARRTIGDNVLWGGVDACLYTPEFATEKLVYVGPSAA